MRKSISFTIALIMLWGCAGGGHNHGHEHGHEEEEGHEASGEIVLSEAQAEAAGIETETVMAGTFAGAIRVGGKISAAPGSIVNISASTSGFIHLNGGSLVAGTSVQKGRTIANISTETLPVGEKASVALAEFNAAQSAFDRAKQLVEKQIITKEEFETAKVALAAAEAKYESYRAQGAYDGANGIKISSPANATITAVFVAEGEYVEAGQKIAEGISGKQFILTADVPGEKAAIASKAVSATFKPSTSDNVYDTRELSGRKISNSPVYGNNSFYIPVSFSFSGGDDIIAGSYAEVWLRTSEMENVISVPLTALTEEQGVYHAYVRLDEDCYEKRTVVKGADDGIRCEILSGLAEGDEVVTKGAIHVKLASVKGVIPGHTHNH